MLSKNQISVKSSEILDFDSWNILEDTKNDIFIHRLSIHFRLHVTTTHYLRRPVHFAFATGTTGRSVNLHPLEKQDTKHTLSPHRHRSYSWIRMVRSALPVVGVNQDQSATKATPTIGIGFGLTMTSVPCSEAHHYSRAHLWIIRKRNVLEQNAQHCCKRERNVSGKSVQVQFNLWKS